MPADLPQAAAGLGGRTCGADMLLFQKKGVVVDPYRGFGGGQVAPQPRLGKRPRGAQQLQLQLAKEDLQQKTTRSEGRCAGTSIARRATARPEQATTRAQSAESLICSFSWA